jgi:hypothetical protein
MQLHRLLTALQCRSPDSNRQQTAAHETAYPVPWVVSDRQDGAWIELTNCSEERLSFVRFAAAGEGELALSLPRHVDPRCSVRVGVDRIPQFSRVAMVTVTWRRPNGKHYLWLLSP